MDRPKDFLFQRYGDIQVISNLMTTLRAGNVPLSEKQTVLAEYSRIYVLYP